MTKLEMPRLYVNGFPKSGLHLAELMVKSVFYETNPKWNWFATNAWHVKTKNIDKITKLAVIQPGHYLKGHAGYSEEMKEMLIGLEVGVVFVYRDLRDVAVSQAYHILSNKEELLHPGRKYYPDDFDEVLKLVITGLGDYDGLFERWKIFAPWLEKYWVYSVRYEELLKRPEKAAGRFFDYFHELALAHAGIDTITIDKKVKNETVVRMVKNMKRKTTATYRKGKAGQWRYEFKPEHVELFKEYDKDNVLLSLGFEKRKDWH